MEKNETSISRLIEMAKNVKMTREQEDRQRASFVYGNVAYENSDISREFVEQTAKDIDSRSKRD